MGLNVFGLAELTTVSPKCDMTSPIIQSSEVGFFSSGFGKGISQHLERHADGGIGCCRVFVLIAATTRA
jgi:hypothetical protein